MEEKKLLEKTEQEIQWLRSVVIPEMIKNKKFSNTDDTEINIGQIIVKFIGTEEAFMLTTCYRASVEYSIKNNKHKLCLVVKKTPQLPPEIYDSINFNALFNNEIKTYNTILPAIEKFTKHPFKVPNYFYSDLQKHFATIILEDFGVEGWRVAKEKFNLSLDHILTAVTYLGEFHGIGFAMHDVQSTEFNKLTANLQESRFDTDINEDWILSQGASLKRLLKVTREIEPSVSDEFLDKLYNVLEAKPFYAKQRVEPRQPFVTLCHGDFLRNNIAFQYIKEADEEKPSKTMMFDLQTMRVSSPMMDLTVLLHLSAFAEVRHKNFEKIFNSYRTALIKSYEAYAGKEAPAHLSHDALLREYILFMPYGIQIASFFLMLLIAPDDISSEDLLQQQRTPEEIEADCMVRGGEVVDKEISHQVKEIFDLVQKYGVDIGEGITY